MAIKGVDVLVQVEDDANPGTYIDIGGQRGATLNASADQIDTTSKDSSLWSENLPGLREWSVDCDGLHDDGDAGLDKLWDQWIAGNQVTVRLALPNGRTYTGTATISDLSIEAPHDGEATASASLMGSGALTRVTA